MKIKQIKDEYTNNEYINNEVTEVEGAVDLEDVLRFEANNLQTVGGYLWAKVVVLAGLTVEL
jgi:hypothetical protein